MLAAALAAGAEPGAGSAAGGTAAGVAASGAVAVEGGGALVWLQDWSSAAPRIKPAHKAGIPKRLDEAGMIVTLPKFGSGMGNLPQ